MDIARQRLRNQHIAAPAFDDPADVVSWLGAVQAQDYLGGLWAVGLRTRAATERQVEQALARRAILRTWPMRGTLHFIAAGDVRWMLDLLASRVIAAAAGRMRQLELDAPVFARSRKIVVKALSGGRQVTRPGLYRLLEEAGVSTVDGRGLHILMRFALEGLICFGARDGKQQTFALLAEWAPAARRLSRDEALAELARRYFTSHGPATWRDFAWWSGLGALDARAAIALGRPHLTSDVLDGQEYWSAPSARRPAAAAYNAGYLLPPFDEYTVAYKDRSAVVHPRDAGHAQSGGMINAVIVADARVVGTWQRTVRTGRVTIAPAFFRRCSLEQNRLVLGAAERYARFLEVAPVLTSARQVMRAS
ncbi:MAG: hypothetical protein V7647_2536 [Acidobacteriota bacterium]|jgi:hypothetical protein